MAITRRRIYNRATEEEEKKIKTMRGEAWREHAHKHNHCIDLRCWRTPVANLARCAGHLLEIRLSVRKSLNLGGMNEVERTECFTDLSDDDLFMMAIDEGHNSEWLERITSYDRRTEAKPVDPVSYPENVDAEQGRSIDHIGDAGHLPLDTGGITVDRIES
jgi:hypothetical protein